MFFFFYDIEEWRDLKGFEGLYQISNNGTFHLLVRSKKYIQGYSREKRRYVNLFRDGRQRTYSVELLLEETFPEIYGRKSVKIPDLPGEVWKDIRGFEGLYKCSNKGRIKSLARDFWWGHNHSSHSYQDESILSTSIDGCGYVKVVLCGNPPGAMHFKTVHAIVARTFFENYDMSLEVNHIDGVKTHNNIENLEIVTAKENMQHAIRMGLHGAYGEENPRALLSNEQARKIREMYVNGITRKSLVEMFKVAKHVIDYVVTNKYYKDENYQYKNGKGKFI